MSNKLHRLVELLIDADPELANDIYFALDEKLVKKPYSFDALNDVMNTWVKPVQKTYGSFTIEDAGDGSGDGILTFPEGFCDEYGWKEGDVLNLEVSEEKTLIITKKE
jgi:hypothetical protein